MILVSYFTPQNKAFISKYSINNEKTAVLCQQQMINMIWAQAGMAVLKDITNIVPSMTSIHDSNLIDDRLAMDFINYGDKIIY